MNALHWARERENNGDGLESFKNQCFDVYRGTLNTEIFSFSVHGLKHLVTRTLVKSNQTEIVAD